MCSFFVDAFSLFRKELFLIESTNHLFRRKRFGQIVWESIIFLVLACCACISVLTTLAILYTLFVETYSFFEEIPFIRFITEVEWTALFSSEQQKFGILPLIMGTCLVTLIAAMIALPIGLSSAIYLSEYAHERVRKTIKPILEVLAGIPTIVYGFFAVTFVTPILKKIIPTLETFNALSAGIVVGIMIIPMVASLSEDAMMSVPNRIREAAYALGSTRLEVALRVVMPAAISGITASLVLALSRAIGETMIVTIAAGATPHLSFDPTVSIQTMTAFIVQASTGDISYESIAYRSIYAVGMTLFIMTLIMNMIAELISKRFREEVE